MSNAVSVRRVLSIIAFLLSALFAGEAAARPDSGRGMAVLILSGLPEKGSSQYDALLKIAGDAEVETLDMTKAERWRIPIARVKTLSDALKVRGVTVMRVDRRPMRLLEEMPRASSAAMPPMSDNAKAMISSIKSSPATGGVMMMMAPRPMMAEHRLTAGMQGANTSGAPMRLSVKVTPSLTLSLTRRGLSKTGDAYVWHGTVDGTGRPVVLSWWPDGRIAGSIHHRGRIYSIRHMGGMMHAVIEMQEGRMPPEHAPAPPTMMEKMNMREDPLIHQGDASMLRPLHDKRFELSEPKHSEDQTAKRDAMNEVTLIVAYTPAAARHYTDIARDLIDVAVAEANQSFTASGINNVRLKIVHTYQTDYVESGTHFDHVWHFADKGDGVMEEIHGLRDKYQADIAVLVVDDANGCGLSTRVAADADEAFSVVHHGCAATMYTLAHEIGHLFGARHDRALDDSTTPFAFGHGFIHGNKWRTMMSYKQACGGCKRLPIWSSPEIKINGGPAGDEAQHNNAKVIRDQAARVARFRTGEPAVDAPAADKKQAGVTP